MKHDSIFELRDYSLHPRQRETLINLFEGRFIAPQNNLGAHVRAIFRDIDRPDHFVWLRSFADMTTRLAALSGFYGGPVWAENRDAANATMVDSDDVHLLRPTGPVLPIEARFDAALIVAEIFPEMPEEQLTGAISHRPDVVVAFLIASVENDFPRLPVHTHKVSVVLRLAPDFWPLDKIEGFPTRLRSLRLVPTARSPLQLVRTGASPSDFDFLQGRWHIHNRSLRQRNTGSADWDEFPADAYVQTLLDGVANIEEFICPARDFKGMSLRSLDLTTSTWSIWWINSTMGTLSPPVRGGFVDDAGCFIGEDADNGQHILARFTWSRDPQAPRWEQAFSYDQGATWETNWVMEFSSA